MGLFDRIRATAPSGTNGGKPDTSGQNATRLIEEGHAFEAQGRLDEAMQCYLEAITLAPNPARGHLNRGNMLLLQGDLTNALDAFKTAIKHKPDYAGAYYNLGNALLGNKQLDEAVASYRHALEIQPDYAEVHCSLGVALKELGEIDGAIASFQRALQFDPNLAEAHINLGNALKELGQLDMAVESYRKAIEIKPNLVEAHTNMGIALQELGLVDGALASYRQALEIRPDYAEIHNSLGLALEDLGKFKSAETSFRRALEIKPNYAEAHNNLGLVLQDLGQPESAETCFRRALEIKPDLAEANYNLSVMFLKLGRYAEGWPKYEARYHPNFKGRNVFLPDVTFPQWRGEPLTGKSLVIFPEQGFGDEIQFARYIPLLKAQGASRITLVCKPPLRALFETLPGADRVITQAEAASLPVHDYWTFPMSLPLHFATTIETIPTGLPYLGVPPERLKQWHNRIPAKGLKVGLVWKGNALHSNDVNRSLPGISILAPLLSVPGVIFISLQKGQGEEEATAPPTEQPIMHMGSDIQDFADTAAIVAQLDLVICVDTAIAHMAGALKKPCWVLLPASGTDWRWLHKRFDSPWYPDVMRLFRQKKTSDWSATISDVAKNLKSWVDEHAHN